MSFVVLHFHSSQNTVTRQNLCQALGSERSSGGTLCFCCPELIVTGVNEVEHFQEKRREIWNRDYYRLNENIFSVIEWIRLMFAAHFFTFLIFVRGNFEVMENDVNGNISLIILAVTSDELTFIDYILRIWQVGPYFQTHVRYNMSNYFFPALDNSNLYIYSFYVILIYDQYCQTLCLLQLPQFWFEQSIYFLISSFWRTVMAWFEIVVRIIQSKWEHLWHICHEFL